MGENNNGGLDPFGLAAVSRTTEKLVEFGIDGAKEFLKLTCQPLFEEFGFMVSTPLRYYRLNSTIRMLEKAKGKMTIDPTTQKLVIDQRVAFQIAENASQVSNDTLLDMWAGLFAASCDRYEEDENIFFIDILKRLTSSQVKLLNYLCKNTNKTISITNIEASELDGIVRPEELKISYSEVCSIMESDSRLKVDTELDTLENMGLITKSRTTQQGLPISQLLRMHFGDSIGLPLKTLRLYIKCQGSKQTPFKFFLKDVNYYYHDIIKDYININPLETLNYLKRVSAIGIKYKDDVDYGNELTIKNEAWFDLSTDILNERLRAWLVYRYVPVIGKSFVLNVNESFWNFSYKDGIYNRK